jgi:broad specificity phosphatase PhoE
VLILVRHGRTAYNASRQLQGRIDAPLDELGLRQAAALGRVPDITGAARAVCSPLLRARQTAEALGPQVTIDERWIEMDYGTLDGRPLDQVPAEVWRNYRSDLEWAPPGGESPAAVYRRVEKACEELAEDVLTHDVVVVSHVSPIKAAVSWCLGMGPDMGWRLYLDTASVSRIGAAPGGFALRGYNDTSARPSE